MIAPPDAWWVVVFVALSLAFALGWAWCLERGYHVRSALAGLCTVVSFHCAMTAAAQRYFFPVF